MSRTAAVNADNMTLDPRFSAWIRAQSEAGTEQIEIFRSTLEEMESTLPTYKVAEKQLLLMRALERRSHFPGQSIPLRPESDYPLAWASNDDELSYYIDSLDQRRLIQVTLREGTVEPSRSLSIVITPEGWTFLDEHDRPSVFSDQAFVAMSFSENLKPAWEKGFYPALDKAGYSPYRVDNVLHNEKICVKIMAEIKNSRFLVADVTEQKSGVYFEAGYAIGLGIPVIWAAKKDEEKNLHFDTRQYNHILWTDEMDLARKLEPFVIAIVGKGNARKASN